MTKIILAGVFGIVTACALAGICDPPPAKPDASLDWATLQLGEIAVGGKN